MFLILIFKESVNFLKLLVFFLLVTKTEIFASRGGRTYSINFKINFGKMQEEKRRGRSSGHGGEGSMDMGY